VTKEPLSKFPLYLVSDSSGNLLEHFFSALMTQFPHDKFLVKSLPFIDTQEKIKEAVKNIREGVVFHALVSKKLKSLIAQECKSKKIASWDVTGPAAKFLEKTSGVGVSPTPRPLHLVDSGYLDRMRALEFAMQHDDSRRIEEIGKADIILVGISRVSKSPTALFLAYRGFRAANISIVPGTGLPPALENHRPKNVVAFTIEPQKLAQIRKRRFADWKIEESPYEDLQSVVREVQEAERIYEEKGWPVINTTGLAVEETSTLCLSALKLKPKLAYV
jgi:regulator of PEP synthase PpsR (kinase-PPPase family)